MHLIVEPSNVTKEPTCGQRNQQSGDPFPEGCSLDDWMLKKRHRWSSVLSEMSQGELMGFICCTRIPFYPRRNQPITSLTTIEVLLSQPTLDLTTHFGTGTVELFFVMILMTPYAYKPYVLCLALP